MEICLNISNVRKTILKSWLKTNKLEKFNQWCEQEGMDPIEVKQALGLSSASTSVESKDPSENIEKAQLQEDPHTVVTEYLNNVDSTELLQEFETDLTKSCIIDFEVSKTGIKPIMKDRNKLNDYINEYKETRLDELVTFLQSAGYNVYENRNQSNAELSKKARHALQLFWNNKSTLEGMIGYTQALKAYVILHTFDSTLKSSIPFIDIKRTSNSDLFVKKYEWKGFGAESYTSWTSDEYASAEKNSSKFFKLFLSVIPLIDKGKMMETTLNFTSLITLFAEIENWQFTNWSVGSGSHVRPTTSDDFVKMLSEYENNKTTLSIMRPIVRSLKTLVFGKDSDGKYYVDEFIRNLVINAYLKYEPARYLEVTFDTTRGAMSYDLTQNVAMGARISLLRSIRGQLATLAEDSPSGNPEKSRKAALLNELIDNKYITKKFELASINIKEEPQRKQRISDIFSTLFNIEIDEQLILKDDIAKIENLIQECLNILKKESTPKKVIDETGIYNAGIQSFENFQALTILGKITAASSATKYAKSVIKNGEGNNVPTSQLPNYITQWRERINDSVTGSTFVARNRKLLEQVLMQSIATVGEKKSSISKMTDSEILHMWISSHFCQRFMKDHKGDDVVFIQPTCFADKSTSFLFPIPYNETFSYGLGKSFTIEDIINKVSVQDLDAIYGIVGEIYSEDLLAAKIVADYKRVFPEKLPYSRSGWTNNVSENYELIVKYLNKQSKNPNWKFDLINKFAEAGVDCIEDVHYTNKGANIGALYELKIFLSEQNTKMLFEKIYYLFKADIKNSVWQSLRKDPAVVSFYKKRLNDSKFANDPLYQVKTETLPLTIVKEVDDEEGKTVTLKSAPQHVVPDIGMDFVLQPFFFTYAIFGKSINDYYFGSALAHPNKSGVNTLDEANLIDNYIKISGNQWITQTKRESVGGATYHSYYPNLKGGTPEVIKSAIIEDQETQMNNITGGIDSGFKPMDGGGYSSPILSRAMRVSLLDVSVGENKKTSYGVITSVGTQNNEKWAEYEITNAKMRHMHSRTPLRKMFKKMHSVDITNCETQTFYPTNLFIEYNEKDEFGNVINSEYKQVHIIHIENGKGSIRFVDGTVISEQLNTLDDLFHFIGDCFAKHKEDGQLVYSENTLDILYEYAANNDLIGEIIGYVINKSACKVGVTNLNPVSAWSDDSPLKVFGIKSAGGGPMMDTDHSLEDSEGTESTQMLLALVQNGTSLSETMQVFNDIAEIIDLELHEFEQGITDKEKRIKVADKYTTRSLKRKREGFSTAKQKIDDYHDAIVRGENPEFPIFISDVNTAATSAIRAHVSSNIIKRKYGGIGAVNTPGYNTVMYHVMDGQPMLFEELREHPLYKECLKNGIDPFSQISVEKQVQDENGNERTAIVYNPFIVQSTESSPIDFEDTIVIRHKPVTYLVNSVEDIDGNISLSYVGVDGISYEIDPNDPLYNPEFGTYTSADLYIDENGNYTTEEWSSPIVIDSIEKYFTYRHRTDIDVYNWTIMAHNLKGIDALYHFNLPSGSVTYSINETLYNKAMYFINQVADLSGDIEEQLLEMCRKFRWDTHTYQCLIELLNKYLGISDKKKMLSVMSKDLRTALNSPTEELWLGETENPITPIKVESIPAQIIMGRTYAKQFGLRSGDSIYKIRQEGFWEERYKDRFLVSTNHELLVEKKADIVVFDGSGKRIFIKYDALGDFKPEGFTKSTSFVENSEGVLYYNGEEFIESDSIRTYSYQTITGSTEDVIVINNLDDLQKIKDAGFDVVQFNFTEDNYRYLLPVRYDFDKSTEHYLWDAGKRTDVSITRDSINNDLTKLLIPQLNASEQSSIMHLISKKLKRMSQNFEKSLEFIGTRIPCQSMQSFMACKVIAFTDVEKNEIFIPAKLAWIQGSDYDIDKLYLTGRIFGDNGTLYHHLNKNPKLRAIGLKNKIVDGLWAVTNNPVNQVSGTVAVNIDSLKAVAKKSDLASRQDSFSQFNPGSVASMIYENATGKEVIGISAVANKGNSVVSLYYNRKLASLTEYYIREDWDTVRNILRTLCQWDSEGNIYGMYGNVNMDWLKSWDLSKVPADIVLVLNNIYRKNLFGVDVDLALGELLNAAADNAKELILKKINATGEWTDVWAYALTQGYSIDYIYDVVNDPRLRGAMTTRNIFGGFVQTKKSDILEMFPGSEIANWIKGAEEFSLLSGITKINQGIKTTEFDYLVYSHKFEEGVTKQLFEAANHTETFSMQKFVLDPQYRADMIGLYESKKHTYNILAMFAEHPLFMSMWKAYFVSSMFLQQLSPRETLNIGVISSKRSWYFGQISSDTFKQVSDNLEEKILKRFLRDAEIRKGVTLNISGIQHARNILHKALSKYFSEHKSDNDFTKNVAYTTIVPRFGYEEVAALTPGIDMFEVDKNRNLQLMYAKMLDALQRENRNIMLVYKDSKDNNRRVTMTLSEALWLYSMLFYKPNASMSFTRFVEESRLPNSLATAYYNVVNKLANSPTDIEKIANWSHTGEVAIQQFITKHLEEVSEYIKKQHLSTRVVHSGILENIESEHVKVYDETNLREFKKLGFTEEELQGVKAAKAFIYNGVVYINKNSTYADLFHEMIHIKIANLALAGDITKLQNMYVKISQTEYGQAIIAEVKMNPIYSNLEDADLVEEIVAKYYEQYPEQLPREFIGEINEDVDSYVKDVLEDTISAESLQTTAIMQKVRTFRNKKLGDGTIERNCD